MINLQKSNFLKNRHNNNYISQKYFESGSHLKLKAIRNLQPTMGIWDGGEGWCINEQRKRQPNSQTLGGKSPGLQWLQSLELDFQMWHSDFLLDNVDRPCHMEENPWIWDHMPTGRKCLSLASVQKFSREGLGLV